MDGIHDIGGMEGFGPIETKDDERRPFKAAWEARMWGINEAITNDPDWTIDWWRHVRELIPPVDFLTRPYFDQWAQVYAALLVDSGLASVSEIAAGRADQVSSPRKPPMRPTDAKAASRFAADFRGPAKAPPAFAVDDMVTARGLGASGHTRLPRYVRGRTGRVHAYRGAFLLPEAGAKGVKQAEPLYTIAFAAADLWPEAKASPDRVFLDLWESYLEPRHR